ncbi:hypothetical protein CEY16_10480 [Halalkalibacillus sediminis]|uniref:Uncharacterized protein n=1 Tax=Halalkalibacillus sediminis TaxID=2018042 RepID=A0A2I0QS50_9BACI|nr:hypothetical protein [Halalkalibacillus sediminis]PKR77161.1 hypothetical protein CEY16_10480 [Halalkalibacillus sediminis]
MDNVGIILLLIGLAIVGYVITRRDLDEDGKMTKKAYKKMGILYVIVFISVVVIVSIMQSMN